MIKQLDIDVNQLDKLVIRKDGESLVFTIWRGWFSENVTIKNQDDIKKIREFLECE